MRIDPAVERELSRCPKKPDYVRSHDHIFAVFPDGSRVLVGAKSTKLKHRTLLNCIANVRRAIRGCFGGHNHNTR